MANRRMRFEEFFADVFINFVKVQSFLIRRIYFGDELLETCLFPLLFLINF